MNVDEIKNTPEEHWPRCTQKNLETPKPCSFPRLCKKQQRCHGIIIMNNYNYDYVMSDKKRRFRFLKCRFEDSYYSYKLTALGTINLDDVKWKWESDFSLIVPRFGHWYGNLND